MSFCCLRFGLRTSGPLHSNYFHWGSTHILLLMLITDKEKPGGPSDEMFQALVFLLLSQFLQSWQQLERVPSVIIPPQCNFKISSLLSIRKAKVAARVVSKWASHASCAEQQAGSSARGHADEQKGEIASFLHLCCSIWGNKCCYKHGEEEGATATAKSWVWTLEPSLSF